ncbi:hypothetical protein XENOCAPTIV_015256 [Xenoophorus captivus]|uniref:Uncharacterized protein n=1 Tax=Xenoophorus captivus TaxID=1517983 RepID=A0ABV0QLH6_9TELE
MMEALMLLELIVDEESFILCGLTEEDGLGCCNVCMRGGVCLGMVEFDFTACNCFYFNGCSMFMCFFSASMCSPVLSYYPSLSSVSSLVYKYHIMASTLTQIYTLLFILHFTINHLSDSAQQITEVPSR